MATNKFKVLISGAGIAGPCLAYWLAQTQLDIEITIIERSAIPRMTGQAIDIRGPAVDIIKKMKLEEAVRSRSTTEEGTVIRGRSGKVVAQFVAGDVFTSDYEILRADLSQLFLEATETLPNVRYVYGDSVKSLTQTATNVLVSFTKGSADTYDIVVGADGASSKVRSMILDNATLEGCYKFVGQYLAFFSIPRAPSDDKMWHWYNAPKGLGVMLRPHRDTSTMGAYLCITTPARGKTDPALEAALEKGPEAAKQVLHEYFASAGWETKRVLNGLDSAEDFYMSRAAHVSLSKWTNGRAVLIGDAAFATFGVGTSLAIEAGYVLAGELSKIKHTDDIPQALVDYEKVFRTLYSKMDTLPPGFPQLAFPQTSWGIRVRDALAWFASKTKLYRLLADDGEVSWKPPTYEWKV